MIHLPSVSYRFDPPFLFDCRLRGHDGSARRMGLGDQAVQISTVQAVAAIAGLQNVSVWYNPSYPGAGTLWSMSGLPTLPVESDQSADDLPAVTVIPMRHHILEDPIGRHGPCHYGEMIGYPGAQALFNLGWHEIVRALPITLSLVPSRYHQAQAVNVMENLLRGSVIACQPLEITRGNRLMTPSVWRQELIRISRSYYSPILAFGCSRAEFDAMTTFIAAMDLPRTFSISIIVEPLPTWKAIIDRAAHFVTGNTGGMWLGIASETPMTIMGVGDNQHGQMWDAKPEWFTEKRLKTVTLKTWQHFQNTLPCPALGRLKSSQVVIPATP